MRDDALRALVVVLAATARCVLAVAIAAAGAAGCRQQPEAQGVVVARPYLYVGSSYTHYLRIRTANGTTVRQRVGSRTWHRCHLHDRYPECDHG